jgi:flagellar basal-body rod protein FlgB
VGVQFEGSAMRAARTALDGLARRQEAIGANVANIDTVGYQRRGVDFEQALATEVGRTQHQTTLAQTDPRHLSRSGVGGSALSGGGPTRNIVSERNDSNSVNIDEEMTLLAETQIRYQALTQSISTRLGTLRTVIRG